MMKDNEIKRKLTLPPNEFYEKHLLIMSSLLPRSLTIREINILSKFMAFEGVLVAEERFNTLVRKKVREEAGVSSGNLSNYLNSMIKKGYLSKNSITNKITINKRLWPDPKEQEYKIILVKDGNKTG